MSEIWRKPFYAGIIVHNMIDQVVKSNWDDITKDFLKINNLLESHNHMTNRGYNKEQPEDARPLNGDLICGNWLFY